MFLFSTDGELLLSLKTLQHHTIAALANREPGVLWIETEDAIEKVLYGGSLSSFGQQLGLPVNWPTIGSWNGRIFVCSEGRLYEAAPGVSGEPSHFELQTNQPPGGVWALAARGPHMLVGNPRGLFSAEPDGTFRFVASVGDLAHLVMVDPDHCYAIGRTEIALFECRRGEWTESAPRILGVGPPSIVHRVRNSVWIEMGGDGVARLWMKDRQLHLDVVTNASWTKAPWVNIGAVDDTVVLSGLQEEPRRFFDERTASWCEAPQLQRLFDRSPYWIARMQKDETGIVWATHNEGLVRFTPHGSDYDIDTNSFDLIDDRYPVVRILPGNDVWLSAARSLYHIEHPLTPVPPPPSKPILVSLVDLRQNTELLGTRYLDSSPNPIPYSMNSLTFRFYSGSDSWRRPPVYEYRLHENEPWTVLERSLLSFLGLREGKYLLHVRIVGAQGEPNGFTSYAFEILPPWSRSWPVYTFLVIAALLVVFGAMRWSSHLARKRTSMLEGEVIDRNAQLKNAMAKLNEETRYAATLDERNRLANEMHDSVQQGLTGAILQLETTLKLSAVAGEVRSRLVVMRNMISYARQEVQHAIWDMESPLLEGAELADALRKLNSFVDSSDASIDLVVFGTPVALTRLINHNLLRIAQEATTNAFRHADAQKISIRLEYDGAAGTVSLEIADDGIGFCAEEVLKKTTGHFGLIGIRARARRIDGELVIRSSPDQGTSIRVVAPITGRKEESDDAKPRRE